MTLTRSELRSWVKLIGGIKALLDALDRQLRTEAGMSHDDYLILSRLHRAPDRSMGMGELASAVEFSPSRLSHAVDRLEGDGWLCRVRSTADRRVIDATLTEEGLAKVEEVSPDHLALVRRLVFENLGPERAGQTAEAMDQVGRAAESSGLSPHPDVDVRHR